MEETVHAFGDQVIKRTAVPSFSGSLLLLEAW